MRAKPNLKAGDRWALAEARSAFDDLIQRARQGAPQRVTIQGQDAVVVLDAAQYERMLAAPKVAGGQSGAALVALMAAAHLDGVDFERNGERSPVRDVVW